MYKKDISDQNANPKNQVRKKKWKTDKSRDIMLALYFFLIIWRCIGILFPCMPKKIAKPEKSKRHSKTWSTATKQSSLVILIQEIHE